MPRREGMELLIVRHAVACRARSASVAERWRETAVAGGYQAGAEGGSGLKEFSKAPDRLLTSPLVRARQTAQILTDVAGWPQAEEAPGTLARTARAGGIEPARQGSQQAGGGRRPSTRSRGSADGLLARRWRGSRRRNEEKCGRMRVILRARPRRRRSPQVAGHTAHAAGIRHG